MGAGAVRQTARTTGNMALKARGKEAKYATKADVDELKNLGEESVTFAQKDYVRNMAAMQKEIDEGIEYYNQDEIRQILFDLSKEVDRLGVAKNSDISAQEAHRLAVRKFEGARDAILKKVDKDRKNVQAKARRA